MDIVEFCCNMRDYAIRTLHKHTRNIEESEEVVNDALVKVIERQDQFKGTTPGELRSWFLTICVNTTRNRARKVVHRKKNIMDYAVHLRETYTMDEGLEYETLCQVVSELPKKGWG